MAALLLGVTTPVYAQLRPVPNGGDARLQTVRYDADQVVQLAVADGYQLMVAFDGGERIETVAVGDSTFWQATANKRGDALFVKSLQANSATNMTVVTDTRVYSFDLVPAASPADAPYVVRFTYASPVTMTPASDVLQVRYRYRLEGARALRPSSVASDGRAVSLIWPDKAPMPAVFRIDEDGQETLVNGEMRDGAFVIPGTPAKLVFRLDRLKASATRQRVRGARVRQEPR